MLKNKLYLFAAIVLGTIMLPACSDDEKEVYVPSSSELKVLSMTPASDAKVAPGQVEVSVEFNEPILIADTAKITFNGHKVDYAYTAARFLKAKVQVTSGSANTLKVDAGALHMLNTNISNVQAYTCDFAAITVSSNRSIEAQRLLKYMEDNTGVKMLSGVCACVNWNQNEAIWVYKHTGKYPAINNFDFIHDVYSTPGGWIDYSNITPAQSWADANGIVSAMWHWGQISNDGSTNTCTPGWEPGQTSFSPSSIFDPTSDGYKKMIGDIDRIAGWMKPLADLHIPILWRPLHEAQGNWSETLKDPWRTAWFWWGIDGPEACVEIWKVMYDRMVNYHGLTNLIWVYNAGDSMLWYPGDEYVDIVGFDFYHQDMAGMEKWYKYMKEHFPGKLIAITECGDIPKLSEQWAKGLYWNFFVPWWDNARTQDINAPEFNSTDHNNANIDFWNDYWNCDFMVSRDMLPSFRD